MFTFQYGSMFDIEAVNDVVVKRMDIHMESTNSFEMVKVYTKYGTHRGYERRPGAWKEIFGSNVSGSGVGSFTSLPDASFASTHVLAGNTQAFYVSLSVPNLLNSIGLTTGDINVQKKVHFNLDNAISTTILTATTFYVKAKSAWCITSDF